MSNAAKQPYKDIKKAESSTASPLFFTLIVPKLEEITFGAGFKTSHTTNMGGMFNECSALKSVDLSGFDTSKVTNMGYMFDGCTALEELDLTSFDLTKLPTSGSGTNSWGGTYMFRNVGKNATNQPVKIYLNDASYKHIEKVRELKKENFPDSSAWWLGTGEGTYWVLVNADAE